MSKNTSQNVVESMLHANMSPAHISDRTGLPIQDIRSVSQQLDDEYYSNESINNEEEFILQRTEWFI